MPIIANAKKALRQTKTRTERNRVIRAQVRTEIKKASKNPEPAVINSLFSTLDRAVKRGLVHKNKAARLKSRLSKPAVAEKPTAPKAAAKKTAVKKTAAKKPGAKKASAKKK